MTARIVRKNDKVNAQHDKAADLHFLAQQILRAKREAARGIDNTEAALMRESFES